MAKRNHADSGSAIEPRASKRHRADPNDNNGGDAGSSAAGASPAGDLKTVGMKMWQTLKDAEDKDGRPRSALFLLKPVKKDYPDYYAFIKQPIAFEDIRKKLNHDTYSSLAQIKADFELCFNNAKAYNLETSQVYADADALLKLTGKTYKSLLPPEERNQAKDEAKGPGHSLNKHLKSRLKKLMELTDDSGRLVCEIFIDLPPKHLVEYYKEIKQPECLSNIMHRVKKKEYSSAEAFAEDVELVFRNAVQFNHSQDPIHLDAITLRNYFKELMSDLPAPYTLSKYTKPSNLKINLKLPAPQPQQPSVPAAASAKPAPAPARTLVPAKPAAPQPSLPKAASTIAAAPTGLPVAPNKIASPVPELPKAPATVVPTAGSSKQAPAAATSALPVAPNIVTLPKAPNTIVPVASTSALPVAANIAVPSARNNAKTQAQGTPVRTITAPSTSGRVLRNSSTPQPAAPPVVAPAAPTYQTYQPTIIPPGAATYSNPSYPAQYLQQNAYAQQQQFQNNYIVPAPPAPPGNNNITAKTLTPPPPAPPPAFPLRYALLKTEPRGRNIALDHRTGVLSWSVGLAADETTLRLKNILFLDDGGDLEEGSADEDGAGDEESDEDVDMDTPQTGSSTRGRGRGGRRGGRGRRKGKAPTAVKATRAQVKKAPEEPRQAEIAVKLDGSLVTETSDGDGWVFTVSTGSHVVELGEKSGMVWKVYIHRR